MNSLSVYEWLNGLWRKWNTLLMWIMKWHQKVFFARVRFVFFFLLLQILLISKYTQSSYRATFCIFSTVAHTKFLFSARLKRNDVKILRVWLFIGRCLVFVILTDFWNAFVIHTQIYSSHETLIVWKFAFFISISLSLLLKIGRKKNVHKKCKSEILWKFAYILCFFSV